MCKISNNVLLLLLLLSRFSRVRLCDPIDGSPPGSPVPGILQARTLEWVAISFSNAWKWKWKVKVKSLSRVWLLVTPWTTVLQVFFFFFKFSILYSQWEFAVWQLVLVTSGNFTSIISLIIYISQLFFFTSETPVNWVNQHWIPVFWMPFLLTILEYSQLSRSIIYCLRDYVFSWTSQFS